MVQRLPTWALAPSAPGRAFCLGGALLIGIGLIPRGPNGVGPVSLPPHSPAEQRMRRGICAAYFLTAILTPETASFNLTPCVVESISTFTPFWFCMTTTPPPPAAAAPAPTPV